MNDTRVSKKDKNQHIQVFVRVRPINNAEKNGKSTTIVEVPSNKEVLVHERPQDKLSKKFTFDRVFGPSSKQIDVYNAVVSPLLEEVLAGYNCTVFAYGQTGTGKTFTMEGLSNDPALHWQSDTTAGMIPRSLSHLFDELRLLEAQEYTVRVSFLELYNEELFDLLSASDDASKIRLYEDTTRKGAVIIHGLEEVTVHNKSEVYKILEKGSEKRQTAATLMNAHSSRSHTVFSITVHIKENTVDGEELLKTGKLNLVDLAGSENVGRSGAVDRRAREAGSINQSLLTLGRVITALVERAPHIPYRESKLTRLLQESLGGRTKTSIIATVSPASINLEETLSTLDYAHRAKHITNRPEINQKLSKKALLKEYTEEIERLRRDLLATRERNGVYLAHENYNEMRALIDSQGKEIEEKINHIKALEETMQSKEKLFSDFKMEHIAQTNELHQTKNKLDTVTHALKSTSQRLELTEHDRDEQKYLVEKHASTEKILLSQAQTLLNVADTAVADTHKLHDKIVRKSQVEQKNETLGQQFRSDITERFHDIETDLLVYTEELKQFCMSVKNQIDSQIVVQTGNIDTAIHQMSIGLTNQHLASTNCLTKSINDSYARYQNWIQDEIKSAANMTEYECQLLTSVSAKLAPKICQLLENEIAKNLQLLNEDISKKLEYVSAYVRETINSICNYRLEDCDRLCQSVKEIKENMEVLVQNQNEIMEKRRAFARMMEDLSVQFNLLNKSEEENYLVSNDKYHRVSGVCNTLDAQITQGCNTHVNMENELKSKIEKGVEEIKQDVATGTEKNAELARITLERGTVLVNELRSTINTGCDGLKQYKNLVECNAKEMCRKANEDRGEILFSVNDIHKIVVDAGANHAEFMEEQKIKTSNISAEIGNKLGSQSTESTDWNKRITEQLRVTRHRIDKFFVEDIQRDVPTGSTPARREFSYPRQFAVTSPHERILHRFREARKLVEMSEDEDDTLLNGELTMKHIANSTALSDVTGITNVGDSTRCVTPPDSSNVLSKHFNSCSFIDSQTENVGSNLEITRMSMPSRVRSESDLYIKQENKENGNYEFLKPEKTKGLQPSKLRRPKRQVLGTYN